MTKFLTGRRADDPVAFGDGTSAAGERRTMADLGRDAGAISGVLPDRGDTPRRVLLVFERDRYAFATALVAVWARGHVAVIPPDNRRATLTRLKAESDTVLHDTYSGLLHQVQKVWAEPPRAVDSDATLAALKEAWARRAVRLELWSSGTSGPSRRVPVEGRALVQELAALDAVLPLAAGARVASTVPIGHRFGLVWGVLRPLLFGGAFSRAMRAAPSSAAFDTLVTVPVDLMRALEGRTRSSGLRRVVSSLMPLSSEVIRDAAGKIDGGVTDVLSLSAYGAIAYRVLPDDVWRAFPKTRVAAGENGTLRIESAEPGRPRQRTEDLVEPLPENPSSFIFLGRADARLALSSGVVFADEIASHVRALNGVEDAAVVFSPAFFALGAPRMLIAVAGARVQREDVHEHVRACFDVPQTMVDVTVASSLPRDGFGRLPLKQVRLMFGLGPDGTPRVHELVWGPVSHEGEDHRFEVFVPDNYRWFDGHFEQYPVLPAAVQLHELVLPCAERVGFDAARLAGATRLKFTGRISPGQALAVRLQRLGADTLSFEIVSGERSCSSGRLVFGVARS